MKQVNLYEAKTQLSKLVEQAAAGEEIIIAKNGKPFARLTSVGQIRKTPKLGLLAGSGASMADDFDAALPDEEAAIYEAGL